MVKKATILFLLAAFMPVAIASQVADTMTGVFKDRVRSLQTAVNGDVFAPPVIMLGTSDYITFTFDHLAEDREFLRYSLVHCNADWQPSQLVSSEYLDGFNEGRVEDYAFSQVTTVHYVNYSLTIPNVEMSPLLSGNYLLRVYPENDPDDVWLQCRFMVSEQSAAVVARVTSRTDVDYNREHQQLEVAVDTEKCAVEDPFNDLTVMIQQNGRYDNEVALRQPLRMSGRNVSHYEHMPKLIFDAGNEYRRFETVSTTYPGMRVENIEYRDPYYHMALYTDESRAEDMYLYDQTQHGRFYIREYNSDASDTEADYVVVHFSLETPEIPDAMVFIDGDMVCRRFDPESLMTYNRATGRYERVMLLKQGSYNYQYLVVPKGESRGYTGAIEGDKYQTVNEYLIKVYYKHPGDRYDRLIGVTAIFSDR